MTAATTFLVVVGLAACFGFGWVASRFVRKPSVAISQAVALIPVSGMTPGSPEPAALLKTAQSVVGIGSHAGIQVMAEPMYEDDSPKQGRLTRTISASSAIATELGRLGSAVPSAMSRTKDLYRVTVRDGGTPRLMKAAGGGYYGEVVNKVTGRIESKAILNPLKASNEAFAVLGPQAVWGLAAFAVGQHFEAEIAARLENIERKLDQVIEEIDRERLAELDAASRECERAAFKIIDGRNPVDVVAGLSTQKAYIDKNWSLSLRALAGAEKKLAQLEDEDGLTAAQVSGMWEELFGEKDRFSKDVRLFLSALASKMKLISLLAVEDAAGTDPAISTGVYRNRLFDEMKECHQALERLRSVLHRTVRLEYSLGMSDWMPASMLLKGKKEKSNRLLATLRTLLELEDQLEQLHLPFAGLDMMPQYDLIAERNPDGSLEVGLERIVAPVEVALG